MGIKHLNRFLREEAKDSIKFISLSEITGKKIAVDISIYMYKYASDGTLIENIYLMLSIFRYYNIIPIFIFDGKPPDEKKKLLIKRREDKKEALEEYNKLKKHLEINKEIEESIKQVHFNEDFPEYNNVFITNMRDNLAYVFNGDKFISIHKNEMLNELIDQHTNEINISLDKNKNKISQQTIEIIETLIDKLNDKENKFTDNYNNKTFDTYRACKA
jgi:hypothetical protein